MFSGSTLLVGWSECNEVDAADILDFFVILGSSSPEIGEAFRFAEVETVLFGGIIRRNLERKPAEET